MNLKLWIPIVCLATAGAYHACVAADAPETSAALAHSGLNLDPNPKTIVKVHRTDAEWQKILPAQTYGVLRKADTEQPFTGATWDNHVAGTYQCAGCGLEIFSSKTKFNSGTGWPSFWEPVAKNRVDTKVDNTLGYTRTEVTCARCGGHLGHVFDDGPKPTGLRYCMNSAALRFVRAK